MRLKEMKHLLHKYRQNTCTEEEKVQVERWFSQLQDVYDWELPHEQSQEVHDRMLAYIETHVEEMDVPQLRPIYRRRSFWWAAAALLLLGFFGIYQWLQVPVNPAHIAVSSRATDIAPGRQGAVLTLSNGTQVVLDSLGNGLVATQNGTQVVLRSGQLVYHSSQAAAPAYNTMSTPRGRQFQVTLPDGTQVWLNSASSITYPTVFAGRERKVAVKGEVYFEVVKDATRPFRVDVNGRETVEVLGTHFNVNAYDNESSLNTTLLEGAVRITLPTVAHTAEVILKPGQQARLAGRLSVKTDVDMDKVMAWKNGTFNFDGVNMEEAMRQLERWYDIEVVYENGVPEIPFAGEISRNVGLAGLLKLLGGTALKFRIEDGRKLIIKNG